MTSQPPAAASVAVIVTCYNYAAYVREAIDSVLAQTHGAQQIIVVDDGSTDDSLNVLQRHYGEHPSVQIIHQDNAGQLAAFATGIAAAEADLLTFLDADDIWRPGYLARVVEAFDADPQVDIVVSNVETFGADQGTTWFSDQRDRHIGMEILRTAYLYHWCGTPTSGIALRRALARRLMNMPEDMPADWISRADDILIFGSALLGAEKQLIGEPLVGYRTHDKNHWFGQKLSSRQHYRYCHRLNRMLAHYTAMNGVNRHLLRHAHIEFRTLERPRWRDFRDYSRLCFWSPLSLKARCRQWLLMLLHVWRVWRGTAR